MFQKIYKSFLGTLLQRSNNQTKQFLDSGEMWSSSVVQRELNSARPHPNNNAIKAENHENAKIERLGGHVTVKTGELWIAYHLGMCHCRFNASQFSQSAPTWPGPWDYVCTNGLPRKIFLPHQVCDTYPVAKRWQHPKMAWFGHWYESELIKQ